MWNFNYKKKFDPLDMTTMRIMRDEVKYINKLRYSKESLHESLRRILRQHSDKTGQTAFELAECQKALSNTMKNYERMKKEVFELRAERDKLLSKLEGGQMKLQ
jgi:hypothetical protein